MYSSSSSTIHHPRQVSGHYEITPRMTPRSRRHAAPPGPWPWMDLNTPGNHATSAPEPPCPDGCIHSGCVRGWQNYPQSLFPNWTPRQVERCGIARAIEYKPSTQDGRELTCVIHRVDVLETGKFELPKEHIVFEENANEFYEELHKKSRPNGVRVRALFLERLSGPVLQMLGTKYNVEPFFFSSSLNWIPSRYQEEVRQDKGDHITITLTFIRTKEGSEPKGDTESQLPLNNVTLVLDLLAVHMVRARDSSTILSFHPPDLRSTSGTTTAEHLHSRVWDAGQSVYWQNIFNNSKDPTFVLLTFLWYALYAWDEALEMLYLYINSLEPGIIEVSNIQLTQKLHQIRAHLLNYASLLSDFHNSVKFVLETPNPALESNEAERQLMKKECYNLLSEIERLQQGRDTYNKRLKNVMNLVFSSVNIEDSKRMQELTQTALDDSKAMKQLTQAAVHDSAAMKQIAYLTMVFLPASFAAGVFGMNIREINPDSLGSLLHYVETAVPLTVITIWIVMAFQRKNYFEAPRTSFRERLSWPIVIFKMWAARASRRRNRADDDGIPL